GDAGKWSMAARWQGITHRIELNGRLDYRGPLFNARLDPDTFAIDLIEATGNARDGDELSLEPAAVMFVLLRGLMQSLPYLPVALPPETADAGRVAHPGYVE
ncbi:MAG: hypothetical protein KJO80_11425, partial [Gammaproteobacteria bacterium]|nr:hypothetical protein [Gammaproteobacteria bacterium]